MAQSEHIATVRGAKTKRSYKVFWNPSTKKVFVERSTFFGTDRSETRALVSSREMALHAAEAYLHDK